MNKLSYAFILNKLLIKNSKHMGNMINESISVPEAVWNIIL